MRNKAQENKFEINKIVLFHQINKLRIMLLVPEIEKTQMLEPAKKMGVNR